MEAVLHYRVLNFVCGEPGSIPYHFLAFLFGQAAYYFHPDFFSHCNRCIFLFQKLQRMQADEINALIAKMQSDAPR